jgi:protein-tyrosine kinase
VVVDTPAAAYGADATVIGERCGAALMLARQDVSPVAAVEALAIELSHDPSSLAGVVMNRYRNGTRA